MTVNLNFLIHGTTYMQYYHKYILDKKGGNTTAKVTTKICEC